MGFFGDMFKQIGVKKVADHSDAAGLERGDHMRNCERCARVVRTKKSPTGLACSAHQIAVPANRVCGHFTR